MKRDYFQFIITINTMNIEIYKFCKASGVLKINEMSVNAINKMIGWVQCNELTYDCKAVQ